jgi:hypothetical protein
MLRPIMAALAEFRGSSAEQFRMIAPMRFMAGQAVFPDRWMLPHERTSFVSMACITEFVYGIRFELLVAERTVNVVAAAAFDQALFDGVVRLLV